MTQSPPAAPITATRREPGTGSGRRLLLAVHGAKLGGAERMALLEAKDLGARFALTVAIPDGPLRSQFAPHGELVNGTATLPLWGASWRRWIRSSVRSLLDAFAMAMLIRRRKVEAVLTNSSVCLAPVLAAKLARVPVLVHARDVPKSRLARLVLGLQGTLADTVIVISDGMAPYFRSRRRTRVVQIPDGITMPERPPAAPRHAFGSPARLCVVGGIDPRKGQDIAVAAVAQLRERGIAATLELVGREVNQPFAARVREEARRLGVASDVELVGEVADAGPNLDRADIVLAPSRGEWTPLVLMEALARGKPVVAARVGGVTEVVRDREFGLLVAPESPAELAGAIAELLADPTAAAIMAERGREHIDGGFRVERTLQGLRAEIARLLDGKPGGTEREPAPVRAVL
jgi:glycosyltransferase involved in cell wall biosynthesis